ncbi:inorganic triphosphatase [Jinshanibacter sp. LJY008]|uniref:Inorganic triphosphatase n=1 Tax=Limnobaculum eriocheiris TaxID=2897391 RepID=A0A9X1MYB5_9GAMM|nr:inorganic triphosphatase [Limnobaculum eriocheiris]MCD1127104.1 inorganic triphosphatase [Limnobaculum eriocheiris]
MTVEIELKFVATSKAVADLPEVISRLSAEGGEVQQLSNTYYDTADGILRHHRIGLRVRGCNNAWEMTLKSAGNTVGGVAHRAEHNIPLSSDRLDISLLPADVWPAGVDISSLVTSLQPLFTTDFKRQSWLIKFQQSQIEIALDRGLITADGSSEAISELEMELKQGNAADILTLAQQLTGVKGLRLGSQSKAARGYRLLNDDATIAVTPMDVLVVPERATVEQGFEAALEWALAYWQRNEACWFDGESQAQAAVTHSLTAIRQILALFGGIIPRKATAPLRERLTELEQQLETVQQAEAVCYQPGYLQLKLALMAWVMNKGWRIFVDDKGKQKLAGSFKRFADIMLSRCKSELKEAFNKPLTNDGYNDQQPRLERQIINFYLLSGAYDKEQSLPYIEVWQKLFDAEGDRDTLRRSAMEQPLFWLNSSQHV